MPKLKTEKINLLPQDEFESSTLGRILKWALSTFRIMVIITELVVMSAFISRFWLDARNSDLNEELETSQSQIEAFEEIESEFRSIQNKLSIIKSLYQGNKNMKVIDILSKSIPQDISLNTMIIDEQSITIKANSFSEGSIAQFIVNLESNNNFSDISLSQISSVPENPNLISFSVNGKVK